MKVAYLLTTPPPVVPGSDAIVQEVELLRGRVGGELVWLRPSWRAYRRYPRSLLGLHCLPALRQWDRHVDVHHVYAPQLYALPVLWFLKRPVVYTVTSAVGGGRRMPPASALRRLGAIAVPSRSDVDTLTRRGLKNAHLVPPGIEVTRFTNTPVPTGPAFVLLSGSAPWTLSQFRSKGLDVLLEVARDMPDVRLVLLWRGVLLPELIARVERLGLSGRVEILRDRVDVSQVLARVHAAVVLAGRPGLVKAYPHSLLEALAAGRPVMVSAGNPMAEYVRETGCGRVVPWLDTVEVTDALRQLRTGYETYRARAVEVGQRDFPQEALVTAYRELYRTVTG